MGKRDSGLRVGEEQGDVCKERGKQVVLWGREEVRIIWRHLEPSDLEAQERKLGKNSGSGGKYLNIAKVISTKTGKEYRVNPVF